MADNDFLHSAEILRTALPYFDTRTKYTMDLLLKFYELMACFRNFQSNKVTANGFEEQKLDMEAMLTKLRPMCSEKEKVFVDKILSIYNAKRMFEMYNQYMEVMKTMQEFGGFQSNTEGDSAENVTNNFSGFDFSSIFGSAFNSDNGSDTDSKADTASNSDSDFGSNFGPFSDLGSGSEKASAPDFDTSFHEKADKSDDSGENNETDSGTDGNSNMLNMLKNMIPPEQVSTFENLRMLFNTMSYDDNNK